MLRTLARLSCALRRRGRPWHQTPLHGSRTARCGPGPPSKSWDEGGANQARNGGEMTGLATGGLVNDLPGNRLGKWAPRQ